MNYNEFTSYLADRIVVSRDGFPGYQKGSKRYYDAGYNAVFECRAFFDRFSLDEGPHNDYDPTSRASVEAYRMDLYKQMASQLGYGVAVACLRGDETWVSQELRMSTYGGVSITRFARLAAEHLSNIVFERVCTGCGAKYNVSVKAQTYRMISNNHPATCAAVRAAPVQVVKPRQPAPVQVEKPVKNVMPDEATMNEMAKKFLARIEAAYERDRQRELARTGPSIPDAMLKPAHKPAYNSPEYRANAKAAMRLYADFLKFYEGPPVAANSDPEENKRQMERVYNVVVRTVFNFDPDANKSKQ